MGIANLQLFQATYNLTNIKQNFLFVNFFICWMTSKSPFLLNFFMKDDLTVSKSLPTWSVWNETKMLFYLTKLKRKYTSVDKWKEVNIACNVFNSSKKKSLLTCQNNTSFPSLPEIQPYSHRWESTFRNNALLPS